MDRTKSSRDLRGRCLTSRDPNIRLPRFASLPKGHTVVEVKRLYRPPSPFLASARLADGRRWNLAWGEGAAAEAIVARPSPTCVSRSRLWTRGLLRRTKGDAGPPAPDRRPARAASVRGAEGRLTPERGHGFEAGGRSLEARGRIGAVRPVSTRTPSPRT